MLINQVLHDFLNIIGAPAAYNVIAETHIAEIVLVIALQKFLAMQIVTSDIMYKKSISDCL